MDLAPSFFDRCLVLFLFFFLLRQRRLAARRGPAARSRRWRRCWRPTRTPRAPPRSHRARQVCWMMEGRRRGPLFAMLAGRWRYHLWPMRVQDEGTHIPRAHHPLLPKLAAAATKALAAKKVVGKAASKVEAVAPAAAAASTAAADVRGWTGMKGENKMSHVPLFYFRSCGAMRPRRKLSPRIPGSRAWQRRQPGSPRL